MHRVRNLLKREPLIQFALAAAGLFILYGAIAPAEEETIRVTPEFAQNLVTERQELLGRGLSSAERAELVARFVDEEILVREALARDLARRDGKVRQRLVSKMFFLLDEEPREPGSQELEAFYESRSGLYRTPPTVSFEHAYFEIAPADPESVLEALRAQAPAESIGDRFWLGATLERIAEPELRAGFGGGFGGQLATLDPGTWQGPLTSGRGTHFVRVIARHEPRQVTREALGARLREDWLEAQRDRARQRELAELRQRFRVVVETEEAEG